MRTPPQKSTKPLNWKTGLISCGRISTEHSTMNAAISETVERTFGLGTLRGVKIVKKDVSPTSKETFSKLNFNSRRFTFDWIETCYSFSWWCKMAGSTLLQRRTKKCHPHLHFNTKFSKRLICFCKQRFKRQFVEFESTPKPTTVFQHITPWLLRFVTLLIQWFLRQQ